MTTNDVAESFHDEGQDLTKGHDIALDVIGTIDINASIDSAAERKLVHKIDFLMMPAFCTAILFAFLDKAVIGYAAVFNMETDLHLVGTQYSWLSSIFYFGYLAVST